MSRVIGVDAIECGANPPELPGSAIASNSCESCEQKVRTRSPWAIRISRTVFPMATRILNPQVKEALHQPPAGVGVRLDRIDLAIVHICIAAVQQPGAAHAHADGAMAARWPGRGIRTNSVCPIDKGALEGILNHSPSKASTGCQRGPCAQCSGL